MKHTVSLCRKCPNAFSFTIPDPLSSTELHSNHSPTQQELASVEERLKKTNTALYDTEHQIETLQNIMSKLVSTRRFLERTRDQYKNFTSVLRRVPSELWSLIFELASEAAAEEWFESPPDKRMLAEMTPLNISAVCARWRSVSMETPRMWTFFSFDIANFDLAPIRKAGKAHLTRTLRKTRGFPLSVRLTLPNGHPPPHETFLEDVMDSCGSWGEAWIELRGDGWMTPTIMWKAADKIPNLKFLAICAEDTRMLTHAPSFTLAPQLRHLRVQTEWGLREMGFRKQIERIHFERCEAGVLIPALRDCPNVETIILEDTKTTALWKQVCQKVTTLDVRSRRGGFDGRSIQTLFLPNLTSLYLSQSSTSHSFPMKEVIALLERSKTDLTHLEITNVSHMTSGDLVDIIQLSPNLETLIITNPLGYLNLLPRQIIHYLTYTPGREEVSVPNPLLPKLTRLQASVEDDDLSDLLTMLESRNYTDSSNVSRLEYVSVGLHQPPSPPGTQIHRYVPRVNLGAVSTRLQKLRTDGLGLSVYLRQPDGVFFYSHVM